METATRTGWARTGTYLGLMVVALVLGRLTRIDDAAPSLFWPATGVGLLWLYGSRVWAQRAVDGVLLASAVCVVNTATGIALPVAALFGVLQVVVALAGAALMVALWPGRAQLWTQDDLLRLLGTAAAVGGLSVLLATPVSVLVLGFPLQLSSLLFVVNNATGVVVVLTAAFVLLGGPRGTQPHRAGAWESAIGAVLAVALSLAIFLAVGSLPLLFVALVIAVWAGTRLGLRRTALLLLAVAATGIATTALGAGVLAQVEPVPVRFIVLQLFVVLTLVVGLALATGQNEQAESEHALELSHRALEDTLTSAVVGTGLLDLDREDGWWLTGVNPALRGVLGLDDEVGTAGGSASGPPGEVDWCPMVAAAERERVRAQLLRLRGDEAASFSGEVAHLGRDGRTAWLQVHLSRLRDRTPPRRAVLQVLDVTDRRKAEDQLAHLALHDELTDLPNRVLLSDRIEMALALSGRENRRVAVIFLDLDHFKTINDSIGHEAGDAVLREVAHRLQTALRPEDSIARLGGDEFVVCCPQMTSADEVSAVAQRLLDVMTEPIRVHGRDLSVGLSAGVTLSQPGDDASRLIRQSDAAMYAAKQAGRGGVVRFQDDLRARASRQLRLTGELRDALTEDQFVLHYQPIIDLTRGRVVGAEALVRWQHPTRGLLPPREWLDVLEGSEAVVDLGTWVMERACLDAHRIGREYRDLRVHVNVSGRQLTGPGLVPVVLDAMGAADLGPEQLVIELTETHLLHLHPGVVDELRALTAIGIELAVDDFGTGYSSLAQLVELPLDSLKIDRSFVQGMGTGERSLAVVRGVMAMAETLRMGVIAEGVETPEQASHVQALGCGSAQGFLYSRPLPVGELVAELTAGRLTGPDAVSAGRRSRAGADNEGHLERSL